MFGGMILMFEKILIPVDLTLAAKSWIKDLSGLQALGSSRCLLVQFIVLHELNSLALEHIRKEGQPKLDRLRQLLVAQGLTVETDYTTESPRHYLNHLTGDKACDLILVGAYSRSLLAEVWQGDLAYEILHSVRQPVLILRLQSFPASGPICATPTTGLNRHVLYVTDFSANASHAFQTVRELVKAGVQRLTLLHVQDQDRLAPISLEQIEIYNQIDTDRLNHLADQLVTDQLKRDGQAELDIQVLFGSPADEILRYIEERAVSLTVMGTQGRSLMRDLFLGHVSHAVARQSTSAVLLVPPPETALTATGAE